MSLLRRLLGRTDDAVGANGLPLAPRVPQPTVAPASVATAPRVAGSIFLADIGPKKIQVIKVVREASGLSLKEAKDLVESAPTLLASGLSPDAEATLRRALEAAGARVG